MGSTGQAVLLDSYQQLDPQEFAPLVAEALGILPYDAVAMVRDARGIFGERGLEPLAAERLVSAFARAEVEAFAIPCQRLVKIGKPIQVRNLEFGEQEFGVYLGYSPKPQSCPYEALVLATGGWVVETRNRPTMHRRKRRRRGIGMMQLAGGLTFGLAGAALGAKADKALEEARRTRAQGTRRQGSTEVGLADLFVREEEGSFLHIRLRNRDLYYPKILGEEALPDFQVNFSRVICRILNQAPSVHFNDGLECMISEDSKIDPAEAEFGSEKEFTAFTRWLLQITAVQDLLPEEGPTPAESETGLEGTPFTLVDEEEPES